MSNEDIKKPYRFNLHVKRDLWDRLREHTARKNERLKRNEGAEVTTTGEIHRALEKYLQKA